MNDVLLILFGRCFVVLVGGAAFVAAMIGVLLVAVSVRDLLLDNLRGIYSMTVIRYWLKRLEKEGYHTFERAQKDGRAAAALGEQHDS